MPKTKFNMERALLEDDADEELLNLLANDTEPIYKHTIPHRRWKYPPFENIGPYEVKFSYVRDGWWTTDKE